MGEEEQKKEEGKGFAGLSSLVSDVDITSPPAAKKESAAPCSEASSDPARPAMQDVLSKPQPARQPNEAPLQSSSGSSAGKWVLGTAVVILCALWFTSESHKKPSSPRPVYSSTAQTPSTTTPSRSPSPVQTPIPARPTEDRPPVGRDLVLSSAQIRYCLAEDIRLGGARSTVDNYNDSHVDRFNTMIADYNSRCGSYRYRRGALESARREVEPYRDQLQSDGGRRLTPGLNPSTSGQLPIRQNSGHQKNPLPMLLDKAIAFITQQQRTWSQSNATALQGLVFTYASTVNFYGTSMPKSAVMEEKRKFSERWPERNYKFHPNSAASQCDASATCTVTGTVEWHVQSPDRNAISTGTAEASYELSLFGGNTFYIVKESGRAISRDVRSASR